MRTYQAQIKEIEKGIESLMSSLPQTLESIPGIGPVFAAGIVAEIGQIERFTDETRMPNTQVYSGRNISLVALLQKTRH
ncbi:hypothetical protein bpmyx0001_57830 [Bacillus pseudomycoides DSM 12442]|nr:hypothetical protein bpmyx0001_57830 [Bacillus pseudomycoides DSM 12442]